MKKLIPEFIVLVGLIMLAIGVGLLFGVEVSLIVCGVLVLFYGVFYAYCTARNKSVETFKPGERNAV